MSETRDIPEVRPLPAGSSIPRVQLPDEGGTMVDVASIEGPILLAFHPHAWMPTCREHILALESRSEEFREAGVTVFGVSTDPVPTKRAWAEALELEFVHLLSDFWPHGEVSRDFGVFHEGEGVAERASVLIDADGMVRFSCVHPTEESPSLDEIIAQVQAL